MIQQTIGNTVYTVGQELKNYNEAAALLDYIHAIRWYNEFFESAHTSKSYNILNLNTQDFPITITALPNPNPVKYKVGDVLTQAEMMTKPSWVECGLCITTDPPKYQVTKVNNPDPMDNEWREVVLPDFRENQEHCYSEFEALQLAMQEVCKADEVKLEWPENTWLWKYKSSYRRFEITDVQEAMQTITFCFLLGGRVFVKGGV